MREEFPCPAPAIEAISGQEKRNVRGEGCLCYNEEREARAPGILRERDTQGFCPLWKTGRQFLRGKVL